MKALRIIGSIIGAFLLPVVSILLCCSILIASIAGLTTNKGLDSIVSIAMENDNVQNALGVLVADAFADQIPMGNTPEGQIAIREALTVAMEKPSVQEAVSELVKDSMAEVTSGEFNGTLELKRKLAEAIENNPEAMGEITSAILSSGLFSSFLFGSPSEENTSNENTQGTKPVETTVGSQLTETTASGTTPTETTAGNIDAPETTSSTKPNETTGEKPVETTDNAASGLVDDIVSGGGTAADLLNTLDKETVDEILADKDVQALIADVMAKKLASSLFGTERPIDVAGPVGELIEAKPELFEDAIKTFIPDEETKQSVIANATADAAAAGVAPPAEDLTDTELVLYLLDLHREEFNEEVLANLNVDFTAPDIDYTAYDTDAASSNAVTVEDGTIYFDEETTALINELSAVLNTLRGPGFIIGILLIFVLFYLFMSLLTWSFRYGLIFESILSFLTGILLIAVGFIPVISLLPASVGDAAIDLAYTLVEAVWRVLAGKFTAYGAICLLVCALCVAGFVFWTIQKRKKANASAASALSEIKENTNPDENIAVSAQ